MRCLDGWFKHPCAPSESALYEQQQDLHLLLVALLLCFSCTQPPTGQPAPGAASCASQRAPKPAPTAQETSGGSQQDGPSGGSWFKEAAGAAAGGSPCTNPLEGALSTLDTTAGGWVAPDTW